MKHSTISRYLMVILMGMLGLVTQSLNAVRYALPKQPAPTAPTKTIPTAHGLSPDAWNALKAEIAAKAEAISAARAARAATGKDLPAADQLARAAEAKADALEEAAKALTGADHELALEVVENKLEDKILPFLEDQRKQYMASLSKVDILSPTAKTTQQYIDQIRTAVGTKVFWGTPKTVEAAMAYWGITQEDIPAGLTLAEVGEYIMSNGKSIIHGDESSFSDIEPLYRPEAPSVPTEVVVEQLESSFEEAERNMPEYQ